MGGAGVAAVAHVQDCTGDVGNEYAEGRKNRNLPTCELGLDKLHSHSVHETFAAGGMGRNLDAMDHRASTTSLKKWLNVCRETGHLETHLRRVGGVTGCNTAHGHGQRYTVMAAQIDGVQLGGVNRVVGAGLWTEVGTGARTGAGVALGLRRVQDKKSAGVLLQVKNSVDFEKQDRLRFAAVICARVRKARAEESHQPEPATARVSVYNRATHHGHSMVAACEKHVGPGLHRSVRTLARKG